MEEKREALRAAQDTLLGEGVQESNLHLYRSEDAQALVELSIYRHAASLAKVDPAADRCISGEAWFYSDITQDDSPTSTRKPSCVTFCGYTAEIPVSSSLMLHNFLPISSSYFL